MEISWFTENYPPHKGGMARSCDRIISNLRKHHQVHIYHFTNKYKAFFSQANVGGSYTAVPIFEDNQHTLNVLWTFIKDNPRIKKSTCFVSFGSHLCLKGISLMAIWLKKPLLTCFRGNDFDTAIFSHKKQDLLYAIENSAAIACVTKEKCERISAMNLNKHIFFTPNSIENEQWEILESDVLLSEKIKSEFNHDESVVGLIGFQKPKKGIEFFLKCLQRSELSKHVQLRIIGEIDLSIQLELKNSGLPYSICRPSSQTELIANYLLCDLIAIPSIYDGMPNVLFEAGILRKPILAARAGGITDVLSEQEAYLFDSLNELSLLKAFDHYHNASEKEVIKKSHQLYQKLTTKFNSERETNSYLKIFEYLDRKNRD